MIDAEAVDKSINLSVKTINEQLFSLRKKIASGAELSQAEIRLPSACAVSLSAIRRMLNMAGTAPFDDINTEGLEREREFLDSYARSGAPVS